MTPIGPDRESAGVAVFCASKRLEAGMAWLNPGLVSNPRAPYRGVNGSCLGPEGIEEGLEVTHVVVVV